MGQLVDAIRTMTSSEEVIGALRGKILAKSRLEPWTPYKADLSMQGIKVLVDLPRPDSTAKDNFYEDTMLLLQIVREKKDKENSEKKEAKIRAMALEQKRKNAMCGKLTDQI